MREQLNLINIESLWRSGRALECRIWGSEVWFLMGTQNFLFSLAHDKAKNIFLHFFTKLKIYNLSYPICKLF